MNALALRFGAGRRGSGKSTACRRSNGRSPARRLNGIRAVRG